MSKVIPKEQLTAYQRWELGAIEDRRPQPQAGHADDTRIVLPTAEELEHIHQQAWQEGYALGLEEGRKAGHDSGRGEIDARLRTLDQLAQALETAHLRQSEELAREVLELALTTARHMLRNALRIKPELILNALREALTSLPSLNGHHKIFTHPDHVELVTGWLAREHGHLSWKVLADPAMEAGGFRLESTHSELDASLERRWREIANCLGASNDWLE